MHSVHLISVFLPTGAVRQTNDIVMEIMSTLQPGLPMFNSVIKIFRKKKYFFTKFLVVTV